MNLLRAFISGIAIPSVILPILLWIAVHFHKESLLQIPFLHMIPLMWGIWNVLYFMFLKDILPGNPDQKITLAGAILGLLVAVIGVFWLKIPEILGLAGGAVYLPLIIAPILYAILWKVGVKPLNKLVGL